MNRNDLEVPALQQFEAVNRKAFHVSRRSDPAADLVQETCLRPQGGDQLRTVERRDSTPICCQPSHQERSPP